MTAHQGRSWIRRARGLALAAAWLAAGTVGAEAPAGRFTRTFVASSPSGANEMTAAVVDSKTGLTWQAGFSGPGFFDRDAVCRAPWRLPTLWELVTVVDYRQFNPSIDATYFPGVTPVPADVNPKTILFWTSTPPFTGPGGNPMMVDFYSGQTVQYPGQAYFRCVVGN